ncbi:phosphatase PAP2 family protein [Streptantibioticus rubrisoli]|uniref:Phosphatase PAP2 family protein n=1 Tax=Streptantibioticus rubrisoli TaxID=1387313 RepID=A0ABT1PE42_9ACTN|nr:phosphatase PAP2 family protein [Streptantibioticus rubrisoli]MCQ4043646.1 phosphatase PAP2 family protein [Streptantibioticus rubrisoli]
MLFALLTWQVAAHGVLYRWDVRVDAAALRSAAHHQPLRPAAQLVADLGDIGVAVPVLVVALGYAAWRHRRAGVPRWWLPSAVGALAMAVTAPLVVPVKDLLSRPAPGTAQLVAHSGYFPSGHAATAAMAYGLAVLLLTGPLQRAAARRLLVLAAVLLNLAVGAALVWRGYHWPLDVAASWCLSGVLLCLARLTSWWGTRG